MKKATILRTSFKLTEDFLYACEGLGKTPEQVLQQFIGFISVAAYVQAYDTSSCRLAAEFLSMCRKHLDRQGLLLKEDDMQQAMVFGYLRKITQLMKSSRPKEHKDQLYQQLLHDWQEQLQ
jgi:hypothetical protein